MNELSVMRRSLMRLASGRPVRSTDDDSVEVGMGGPPSTGASGAHLPHLISPCLPSATRTDGGSVSTCSSMDEGSVPQQQQPGGVDKKRPKWTPRRSRKHVRSRSRSPSSTNNLLRAVDQMNLPRLPLGKPTELHRLIQAREWDTIRMRLGIATNPYGDETGSTAGGSVAESSVGSASVTPSTPQKNKPTVLRRVRSLTRSSPSRPSGVTPCTAYDSDADSVFSVVAWDRKMGLSRDDMGRTPLHWALTRYTAGSIVNKTLSLRRAPDDILLGLINWQPMAVTIADEDDLLPLHVAAREGHNIAVFRRILELYPKAVQDDNGSSPRKRGVLGYAFDFVLESKHTRLLTQSRPNLQSQKEVVNRIKLERDNERRWSVVRLLLGIAVAVPRRQGFTSGGTPLLLQALLNSAPASVILMLIPPSSPMLCSKTGLTHACTSLYLAISRSYDFSVLKRLALACPNRAREVRDETGMGLISAQFVVWAYHQVTPSGVGWVANKPHQDQIDDAIMHGCVHLMEGSFANWWEKIKFWIWYCNGNRENNANYDDDTPIGNSNMSGEDRFLLHAALRSSDTPPMVLQLILSLYPGSASMPQQGTNLLPLHIAAATLEYTPRHYETTTHMQTLDWILHVYPSAVRRMSPSGKLPLHIAIEHGQSWKAFQPLVQLEPRALRVRHRSTHLYPFQQASLREKFQTPELQTQFMYTARNRHSHDSWIKLGSDKQKKEVQKVRQEYTMDRLTTVFELIKSNPGLVASGIVFHEDVAVEAHPIPDDSDVDMDVMPLAVAVMQEETKIEVKAYNPNDDLEARLAELERTNQELKRRSEQLMQENQSLKDNISQTFSQEASSSQPDINLRSPTRSAEDSPSIDNFTAGAVPAVQFVAGPRPFLQFDPRELDENLGRTRNHGTGSACVSQQGYESNDDTGLSSADVSVSSTGTPRRRTISKKLKSAKRGLKGAVHKLPSPGRHIFAKRRNSNNGVALGDGDISLDIDSISYQGIPSMPDLTIPPSRADNHEISLPPRPPSRNVSMRAVEVESVRRLTLPQRPSFESPVLTPPSGTSDEGGEITPPDEDD
eukprot:scaffold7644_cov50-Attheya_sp.AAC.1